LRKIAYRIQNFTHPGVPPTLNLVLIFITCTLVLIPGCAPRQISNSFIEDVVIARLTIDNDFLNANTWPGNVGTNELTKNPGDIETLRSLLKDNFLLYQTYEDNRMTVGVDLTNSGVIEWANSRTDDSVYNPFASSQVIRLHFLYRDGRWWYLQPLYADNWPALEIDE
jgi:hypothetical protein